MSDPPTSLPQPLPRPRLYEQVAESIMGWIAENRLGPGDRLLPERDLAARLGVSRATVSQALVALEVIGVVAVRHGDGAIIQALPGSARIVEAMRQHTEQLPAVFDARDALETKIAALAASRRTDDDLARIDDALRGMAADIRSGGRGLAGDERFHGALTEAAHSPLLASMMSEISALIRETRINSLSRPGRPRESLKAHQRIAEAVRERDEEAATRAMKAHLESVSDLDDWAT